MNFVTLLIVVSIIGSIISRIKKARHKHWLHEHRQSTTAKDKQQTAHAWISGTQQAAGDPEGRTLEYKDLPEDEDLQPVQPTVLMDLSELHESQHDIVHESVHETIHVRRRREEATATAQTPTLQLNQATLAQALLLSEALGEPRAKRPWQPNRRR